MECGLLLKNIILIAPLLQLSVSDLKGPQGDKEKDFGPVHNWPKYESFGQISAVDVDESGNVYVFHRADRKWDSTTFSMNNVFVDKSSGPIADETIVVLHHKTGSLIQKTGAYMFYLPHGLTVDKNNNLWLTDVALHQVFKFPPVNLTNGDLGKPILSLGVMLEPGGDKNHFCKPTSVVVDSKTKEFYVADGYCNSRLMKFDELGNLLLIIGRKTVGFHQIDFYMLQVPHALALAENNKTLFVADRENSRALSYSFESGKFQNHYAEDLRSKIYSVAYSSEQGGLLFTLANDNKFLKGVAVYDVVTGKLILSFAPEANFTNPHDLAVSHDGKYCYVVELNPFKIWKFKLSMAAISKIKNHKFNTTKILNERIEDPIPAESKVDKASDLDGGNSFIVATFVVSAIVISFLIFMFHYYKRKGGSQRYETRRLILDDDEGGIRLT